MFHVLDERLGESEWLGGPEFSIADISAHGRVGGYRNAGVDIDCTPNLKAWLARMDARPASRRAVAVIDDIREKYDTPLDDAARDIMYGAAQYQRR